MTVPVRTRFAVVAASVTTLIVVAALSWASGSVYSTTAPTVRRPLVMTGMEMLCGGIGCFIAAAFTGEFGKLHADEFTAHAWLAFAFPL